ncbi:MAG: aquaporin [Alphaproteobacteria bacterium]|nr:aquaporin [Alphaproteobacteria bacterium]
MTKSFSSYIAEFLGTLFLVFLGCGAAVLAGSHIGFIGVSFAFGLTLLVLAYMIGPVSGCHVNPGVTIGLTLCGKFEKSHVVPYIISQLLGATVGAFILLFIAKGLPGFDLAKGFALNGFGDLSPSHYSMMVVGIIEVILSALLVFAVLSTTTKGFPAGFGPILVGTTLLIGHLVSIPVSNASINFARTFGPALVSGSEVAIHQLPYFLLFNAVGAVLGAIMHKLVRCGE